MRGPVGRVWRDGGALRAVAAVLASRGFEACPLDLAPTGEPTALHVRHPVNLAYAEVHAEHGALELGCWRGPDDDDGIVARIFRLLAAGARDRQPADPAGQPRRPSGRRNQARQ
jgi:hypothetical protein